MTKTDFFKVIYANKKEKKIRLEHNDEKECVSLLKKPRSRHKNSLKLQDKKKQRKCIEKKAQAKKL